MIRGNRLVIRIPPDRWTNLCTQMGEMSYQGDVGQRMELSLQECECIIQQLPLIVQFVISERDQAMKEGMKK